MITETGQLGQGTMCASWYAYYYLLKNLSHNTTKMLSQGNSSMIITVCPTNYKTIFKLLWHIPGNIKIYNHFLSWGLGVSGQHRNCTCTSTSWGKNARTIDKFLLIIVYEDRQNMNSLQKDRKRDGHTTRRTTWHKISSTIKAKTINLRFNCHFLLKVFLYLLYHIT